MWIANSVTGPLRRLTAAAEHVGTTGRLDAPVGRAGDDEVGRLSSAFDRMLGQALATSREQQRRLVQDAGHELRTPVTSIRTNLDVIRRHPDLSPTDREAVVEDIHAEVEQLTELVNEIVAVSVGDVVDEPREPLDLADVATDVSARYERRSGRGSRSSAEPTPVVAQRAAVQRALSCLLDNATKFDPSGAPIEVSVGDGGISVADRGMGIPETERALVFERFHRADESEGDAGGLGVGTVDRARHRRASRRAACSRGTARAGERSSASAWAPELRLSTLFGDRADRLRVHRRLLRRERGAELDDERHRVVHGELAARPRGRDSGVRPARDAAHRQRRELGVARPDPAPRGPRRG